MISVDGDTSTNDCVFMMANGATGVELETDEDYITFKNALIELSVLTFEIHCSRRRRRDEID